MDDISNIDVRIWSALIGGFFVAVGWIVNGRRNRRLSRNLREERLRDVHRAIYAEIGANLSNLGGQTALEEARNLHLSRMDQHAKYIPYLVTEKNDSVFKAFLPEIHVLPRTSIDPVVAYYAQLGKIDSLTADIRSPGFAKLPVERRKALYDDYMSMKIQAYDYGIHALRMIKTYSEKGQEAARKLEFELRVNSPQGAALSDP